MIDYNVTNWKIKMKAFFFSMASNLNCVNNEILDLSWRSERLKLHILGSIEE